MRKRIDHFIASVLASLPLSLVLALAALVFLPGTVSSAACGPVSFSCSEADGECETNETCQFCDMLSGVGECTDCGSSCCNPALVICDGDDDCPSSSPRCEVAVGSCYCACVVEEALPCTSSTPGWIAPGCFNSNPSILCDGTCDCTCHANWKADCGCPGGKIECDGTCSKPGTYDCSCRDSTCIGSTCDDGCGGTCAGIKDCSACTPDCSCRDSTCIGSTCDDGCGGNCAGIKGPDCSCRDSTCIGSTCDDGCGGTCAGIKDCSACTPDCSCRDSTCIGSTCDDGCGGNCAGIKGPDCSCRDSTCIGSTCDDGCGGSCPGAQVCCAPDGDPCAVNGDCCSVSCCGFVCTSSGRAPCATCDCGNQCSSGLCSSGVCAFHMTRPIGGACGAVPMCGSGGWACDGNCTFPPPPVCACAAGGVCGRVLADEVWPTVLELKGVPVELRTSDGRPYMVQNTDPTGWFNFGPTLEGASFSLNVVTDRKQTASPASLEAVPLSSYTFTLRGATSRVQVRAPSGSFVMLSTITWAGAAMPPQISASAVARPKIISGVVGPNGSLDLEVTHGRYYLTCWKSVVGADGQRTYVRAPATGSKDVESGATIEPQSDVPPENCP